jgi:hypothetical protein
VSFFSPSIFFLYVSEFVSTPPFGKPEIEPNIEDILFACGISDIALWCAIAEVFPSLMTICGSTGVA